MSKIYLQLVICFVLPAFVYGQQPTARTYINKGNDLYDNGKYIEAIQEYQHALAIDENSADAMVEMANTYVALNKYKKAVEYSDKALQLNSNSAMAYTVKGNALDLMDKVDDALEAYKEGIKKFPDNFQLLYNIGFTCFKLKQFKESAYYSEKAVTSNPFHSSSQLLLASSMYQLGKRVQSAMALYYFLFLEPNSKRTADALTLLTEQMHKGVSVSKESKNEINIALPSADSKDEFGHVGVAMSLLEATRYIEKNKDKTEEQLFFENSQSFFDLLKSDKDDKTQSVWWDVHIPFFNELIESNNTETFCYFITQSKNSAVNNKWIADHKDQMDKFLEWRKNYPKNTNSHKD